MREILRGKRGVVATALLLCVIACGGEEPKGEAPAPRQDPRAYLRRGEECLQQAYVILGAALVNEEAARCARKEFEHALEINPALLDAWYQLGFACEYLGDHDKALEAYERAASGKRFPEAVLAQGKLLAQLGRLDEAEKLLQPLALAEALYERGKIALKQNRVPEARRLFQGAVRRDPSYAEAWLNLARAAYRDGDDAAGGEAEAKFRELDDGGLTLERLQTVVQSQSANTAAWRELALAWLRRGRAREAAHAFREALALEPEDSELPLFLGRALMESGNYVEAEKALRGLARREPENANARLYLAAALQQQGREKEAVKELEDFERTSPGNPYVLQNLAILHQGMGDRTTASSYADRARRAAQGRP